MRKGIIKSVLALPVLLISFLLLAVPSAVFSAGVMEEWAVIYDSGYPDNLYAMAKDAQGNVYIGGDRYDISWSSDATITKFDSAGNLVWAAVYDGGYSDTFMKIETDLFGNVYGTGYSFNASNRYDITTVKFNVSGNRQWVRKYGPGEARAMNIDALGNVYVAGYTLTNDSYNPVGLGTVIIKYDTNGNELWASMPLADVGMVEEIAFDSVGNVYLTAGNSVVKYDATNGQALWVQATGFYFYDCAGIGVDPQDNVYVSGGGTTLKLDSGGFLLWSATYESGLGYYCPSNNRVAVDALGNVYTTGGGRIAGSNNQDFVTIKYDTNGNFLWASVYDGGTDGNDRANDLKIDAAGNVFVTGEGTDRVTGDDYLVTVKYDTNGTQLWAMHYTDPGSWFVAPFMEVDSKGAVYVAGYIGTMNGGDWSNVIIKYSEVLSTITVTIDIKPGSYPNSIKLQDTGNIPVAIFSSDTFDASTIDVASLELNGAGVRIVKGKGLQYSFEDVNGDGLLDLMVHFDRGALQLTIGDTVATVTGMTLDGNHIQGADSVKVIE